MGVGGGLVVVIFCRLACAEMGIIQRPVVVHLLPYTIVLPQYVILHPIMVNCTSHPASHTLVTESNECDARPGMM